MRTPARRRATLAVATSATLLALSACSSGDDPSSEETDEPSPSAASATTTAPRVAVSYEGGILVLDGETLEVVADLDSEEFTRLNPAGDDRHVMVTVADGFQVLDTAAGTDDEPRLTDVVYEADTPGHVVAHAGRTVLYADGTSDTTVVDTAELTDPSSAETIEGVEAHHGVSIVLEDGTLLTTVGDAESRSGAVALDEAGEVVAENDECPGVHGEGTAAGEVVVLGCEDGALLYADGAFTKLDAPDQPYGRMGNAYVSETSPLVVGDYKTDPDAEGYLLDSLAVIDTAAETLDVVALPDGVGYTFRDVARGPGDLAYVLATDGAVHTLDPATRELTGSTPVVAPWEGPAEWQDPHPSIKVAGDIAYVTEPASRQVHAVDLTSGEVVTSVTLDVAPNEVAVTG
ncbi:zinc metallochaperone AztD [Nocardioides sp. C4-1]|uniref:zinc metallochaperone AztD n=1 Tax=Nocardioides sp. C4-1 TaxID=3151851 RepID=UPI0032670617